MSQAGRVRPVTRDDAESIASVYNHYIEHTAVTFEEESVPASEVAERIAKGSEAYPWLAYEESGTVAGYAYAARWHSRCAYRLSVETTVYLAQDRCGHGIGRLLYGALLDELRKREFHCAIAGIALPNPASVALHERLGFAKVGEFAEVGRKFGSWVDVGYWELLL